MAEEKDTGAGSLEQATPTTATDRVFRLSDGRECIIRKGKGRDVTNAMRASGSDSSRYLFALIAQVTTIGGSPIFMEDLDELDMPDVTRIQTEFAEINF